jgi:hypothetical protein
MIHTVLPFSILLKKSTYNETAFAIRRKIISFSAVNALENTDSIAKLEKQSHTKSTLYYVGVNMR